jgi:threonine dehydratase
MVFALKSEKLVVEGGGAVALAALLANKVNVEGKCVACVVSGGNVDMGLLSQLVAEEDATGGKQ